ncbi:thioredoxin fold domain-containing protein [Algibacter sp. 2305UL17-15]|uniref:thioredoxin fold domain-containing protein n=1 Tax=Algibacter sp. 2305UL17-15 TaxID=3231268 RepID=UPI0034592A5D
MTISSHSKETKPHDYRLVVFEGSDWCVNCRRLEKNILSDTSFTAFLSANKIGLTRVDFPQRKKQDIQVKRNNEILTERYKFDGRFPTLILSRTDTLFYKRIYYQKTLDCKTMREVILTNLKTLQ